MTKTKRNVTSTDESFHRHYAAIWGEERWQNSLYPALVKPTRYACLLNQYAPLEEIRRQIDEEYLSVHAETRPLPLPSGREDLAISCLVQYVESDANDLSERPADVPFPPPQISSNGLMSHWNLDGASVLVASILDAKPGEHVLDLCAAPGGKSIALAQSIWPHLHPDSPKSNQVSSRTGTLHSNEVDRPRRKRLAENITAYLPKQLFDSNQVTALRIDGTQKNAEYELHVKTSSGIVPYDKILVDAPCSSERHIIHAHAKASASGRTAEEMLNWRPGSSKRLAKTQLDLLLAALKAVKVGGTIVYATCSIEPTENDGVIEKALAQTSKSLQRGIVKWDARVGFNVGKGDEDLEHWLEAIWAERTKHGWIVLPDHESGRRWGPLFFAILTKVDGK